MRQRAQLSVEDVKRKISELKGQRLSVAVNKGRKKVLHLSGVIEDTFPAVFTFRAAAGEIVSFSYTDVICGDIRFVNVKNR